jgi:TP53 regulating kinase and related kinases
MDTVAQPVLFKKGAEASLYIAEWQQRKVVIKVRLPKSYRPTALDTQIRSYRTVHEPQFLHEAKAAGVPTPLIYQVNVPKATITMQFIEGEQVKQLLNKISKTERRDICVKIGESIGKLHGHNLIHGDLTTSNMIQNPKGEIFFLDFGLGEINNELEAKGVDLHLLKRALQSTHYQFWEDCFESVICGYSNVLGQEITEKVIAKTKEIEKRGRYVDERKL